jgi:hypothetical protein
MLPGRNARGRRRTLVSVLVTAALVASQALAASPASAEPCNGTPVIMLDPSGHLWDFDLGFGTVNDGGGLDAYDGWGVVQVDTDRYSAIGETTCAVTADGRELDLPEVGLAGLEVSRKLFTPADGTAFGRFIAFLRNPSAAPITVTLTFEGNLGSDAATRLLATSSGDLLTAEPVNDSWVVSADSATTPKDPPLAHVFDSSASNVADRVDHLYQDVVGTTPWADREDVVRAVYDNVTVPPGATVSYMEVEAQRTTIDEAKAAAPALGAQPLELFANLSAAELASLQNWQGSDVDHDGIANEVDNCMRVANADQANLDRDALGDACDTDLDNDGVSNADEAIRRTDPRKLDSDGDGVDDAKDLCPTAAGIGSNGCGHAPAPKLSLGGPRTVKLKTLLKKGISVSATPNMASTLRFDLLASATAAHIARSYNLVLATATASSTASKRSVKLKPNRRLIGSDRRFVLTLRVTATSASGVSAVSSRKIRVKP